MVLKVVVLSMLIAAVAAWDSRYIFQGFLETPRIQFNPYSSIAPFPVFRGFGSPFTPRLYPYVPRYVPRTSFVPLPTFPVARDSFFPSNLDNLIKSVDKLLEKTESKKLDAPKISMEKTLLDKPEVKETMEEFSMPAVIEKRIIKPMEPIEEKRIVLPLLEEKKTDELIKEPAAVVEEKIVEPVVVEETTELPVLEERALVLEGESEKDKE